MRSMTGLNWQLPSEAKGLELIVRVVFGKLKSRRAYTFADEEEGEAEDKGVNQPVDYADYDGRRQEEDGYRRDPVTSYV